jgi:hypothetical protein
MTLIGKLLAFLNLIVGLAIISWSVMVYTQRPGWFGDLPVNVPPRQSPENFKQMQAEVDALAQTASAASVNWGTQRKILIDLEEKRAKRLKGYEERLKWTRTGNPKDKGNGFYEAVYDEGFINLEGAPGAPIKGSDNEPLQGVDTLLTTFQADVAESNKLAELIKKQREAFKVIAIDVNRFNTRLERMTAIRESVQAEAFYLESFEVNVYETRETVLRRKKQLVGRLTELGHNPEK